MPATSAVSEEAFVHRTLPCGIEFAADLLPERGTVALVFRVLMVLGGLVVGGLVAWTSEPGKQFFVFAQEAWAEGGRVSWPTRKETIQTTAIVFAFVVIMALFLFAIDTTLAWIVRLVTGRGEG